MEHREFTELLHYLADASNTNGLCLITTRYPLKDIDEWHGRGCENLPLVDLDVLDALQMLRKRGIEGSDEDVTVVINRYKGHALSLTLLAGYLIRYYEGDIKHAPEIGFVLGDTKRFEDVNKLLRKYAEKMSDAERTFLNIFSLFRRDVTEDDYAGVFQQALEETGFNDVLIAMDGLDFTDLVNGLVEWRFITYDAVNKTYTTHPLVKGYFESDFDENDKGLCHKHIYRYFGEDAPEQPDTLEEMQPLFEQVYHGCAAGLYDKVYNSIYQEKIYREGKRYIVNILGAWETALSLAKTFFPKGDLSQMPLTTIKSDQSWLLNEAGLVLLSTGRPKKAEVPLKMAIELYIKNNQIAYASIGYQILVDLQFRIGELEAGLESAKKALYVAAKTKSDNYIVFSKEYLAWILHLTGKNEEADKMFREDDELKMKINPDDYRLYSICGVFYANFLLAMKRIDDAFELTKQNLEICQRNNFTNSILRCSLCLGAIERAKGNHKEAGVHLQDALKIARKGWSTCA